MMKREKEEEGMRGKNKYEGRRRGGEHRSTEDEDKMQLGKREEKKT